MESFDVGLFILHVAVGLTAAMHGYGPIFPPGALSGPARWFASMGRLEPGWHHRLAAFTEVSAGAAR